MWEVLAPLGPMVGAASLAVLVLMLMVTAIANPLKNAGIVDVAWAYGFSIISACYFITGPGWETRKLLIALMVGLSSVRLGTHLLRRVIATFPEEDARYHALREIWGPQKSPFYFFLVYIFQGVLMILMSAPFAVAMTNPQPGLHPVEQAGFLLWLVAAVGEALADEQLRRFKADTANRGKICQAGLWRYSRHPNYFFEWLQWCGYFLFALGTPGSVWTIYSPLAMLLLLTKFSGIGATEAQTLKTKGEAYRQYQQSTSAFVPWPPKPPAANPAS